MSDDIKCSYWCDFCDAFLNTGDIGNTVEFEHHVGNLLSSRQIFETEHFAVIVSLGQIMQGYLLILTKAHYPSMAHLTSELFEELELVYSQTCLVLTDSYSHALIFEHGPMPLKIGSNSDAIPNFVQR